MVLIIGSHKVQNPLVPPEVPPEVLMGFVLGELRRLLEKNTTWLKVFYYYGLTSTVATFVMFCIEIYQVEQFRYGDLYTISVMISLAFAGFALQGYIIMLVKNEIMKLENNQQFHFINHTAEAIVETSPTDAIYRNTTVEMI
ncbi:hypothetical protein EVAR_81222_1 [Eumeta japonica]|uniref:Uncharacterized protein n=1 Tax=Eumeta variegata TaxID=151549 RepID=A0A4C1V2D6_EUMVA|nr:hypothetical protein EVAR_81222_1 [Eumeta japonica]